MANASMLEQIARRFETYADDEDSWRSKGYKMLGGKQGSISRATQFRGVAAEIRKMGEDNHAEFLKDIQASISAALPMDVSLTGTQERAIAGAVVSYFITDPPEPTP